MTKTNRNEDSQTDREFASELLAALRPVIAEALAAETMTEQELDAELAALRAKGYRL